MAPVSRRSACRGGVARGCTALFVALLLTAPNAAAAQDAAQEPVPEVTQEPAQDAAQEPPQGPSRAVTQGPVRTAEPWNLSDDELIAEEWEFSSQRFRPGSVPGGLIALTVGSVVHGAGHFYVDDQDSALKLFLGSVIGLGAVGAGSLARGIAPNSDAAWTTGTILQAGGVSLIVSTWIADAIGSFKGTTVPLPDNTGEVRGLALELFYRSVFGTAADLSSIAVVRFPYVGDRFVLRPEIEFAPLNRYRRFALEAAIRQQWGTSRDTHVEYGVSGADEHAITDGWGRTQLGVFVGLRVDAGELMPHLAGLVWRARLGAALDFAFYAADNNHRFRPRQRQLHFPFETSIGMNVSRGLHIELGYRHRADTKAGGFWTGGGSLVQRISIVPVNRIGVEIEAEEGAFVQVTAGIRWFLVGGRDR